MRPTRTTSAPALVAAASVVLAACSVPAPRSTAPTPPPTSTATTSAPATSSSTPTSTPTSRPTRAPAYSDWTVGARRLPLRPDGYGVVTPTPRALRERRLPTRDVLPPPPGGRWRSSTGPVTRAIAARLAWEPGCPVGLDDLRYVTVVFRGFDGRPHTGELVLAASEAADVVSVFRALYAADFPIEQMRLTALDELDDPPTGDGNNTGAYVCRPTTGQTSGWSAHAYGLAVDLDPFQNPYRKGDLVLPELASSYLDRDRVRPGMVLADSLAVREFARIGWLWGGAWRTLVDYQHFSATGR